MLTKDRMDVGATAAALAEGLTKQSQTPWRVKIGDDSDWTGRRIYLDPLDVEHAMIRIMLAQKGDRLEVYATERERFIPRTSAYSYSAGPLRKSSTFAVDRPLKHVASAILRVILPAAHKLSDLFEAEKKAETRQGDRIAELVKRFGFVGSKSTNDGVTVRLPYESDSAYGDGRIDVYPGGNESVRLDLRNMTVDQLEAVLKLFV